MTGERAGDSVASSALGPAMTSPVISYRHRQVLRLAAFGLTHDEIADALGISPHTVRHHLYAVYQRCRAHSLVDALRALGWLWIPNA